MIAMEQSRNTLRLAIQRSGRLSEDSRTLIKETGIQVNWNDTRLKSRAFNFPVELLFLRDDDIPEYVSNGVADIGIVGENLVIEKDRSVDTLEKLGFSRCRLAIAVPESAPYQTVEDLIGRDIATSHPRTLTKFLESRGVSANIHEIKGSAEIAPGIGLSTAICDLVSSGSTLFSNRLREIETILSSEAVLISGKALSDAEQKILDQFLFRLRAVLRAKQSKYILLNVPNDSIKTVCELLPGLKSPTVLPLAEEGWSSVHSVIDEDRFWEVIELLRGAGAEGILVCPIEKVVANGAL